MAANTNGFWDFKSYDEKTWFRDLIYAISFLGLLYVGLHGWLGDRSYNYEYYKLSPDQMQFVSRIYIDAVSPEPQRPQPGGTTPATPTSSASTQQPPATGTGSETARQAAVKKVVAYLKNVFDENDLQKCQWRRVQDFLKDATPQQATIYLGGTLFQVHSYFWLVGPAVYWEVVFCALIGVLCNLIFVLGAVGSNSTTDLANPATQFDSSEILGQVAKIIYAPICTLAIVLGYSFFKGQNIADIDYGKGLLVFGFIGGYYSSRVISLMDRLKDLLLPNTGTASLTSPTTPIVIQQLKVALATDPTVPAAVAVAATGPALNGAAVQMILSGSATPLNGSHIATDPDGTFTFNNVVTGFYTITATLTVTPEGATPVTLKGAVPTGQIQSATAPIPLTIK